MSGRSQFQVIVDATLVLLIYGVSAFVAPSGTRTLSASRTSFVLQIDDPVRTDRSIPSSCASPVVSSVRRRGLPLSEGKARIIGARANVTHVGDVHGSSKTN